jgi:hypothetical protein
MDAQTSRTSLLAGFITEEELAKELGHCERTLARWRRLRIGPPYVMNGRDAIYNVEAARAWLAAGGTSGRSKSKRKSKS